jgi:hypothetical protein
MGNSASWRPTPLREISAVCFTRAIPLAIPAAMIKKDRTITIPIVIAGTAGAV